MCTFSVKMCSSFRGLMVFKLKLSCSFERAAVRCSLSVNHQAIHEQSPITVPSTHHLVVDRQSRPAHTIQPLLDVYSKKTDTYDSLPGWAVVRLTPHSPGATSPLYTHLNFLSPSQLFETSFQSELSCFLFSRQQNWTFIWTLLNSLTL